MPHAPRTLGFVTSARSDFGLLRPLIEAAAADARLRVVVYATGMHFSRDHGYSLDEITDAGLEPVLVPVERNGDGPLTLALAIGRGVSAFAAVLAAAPPDFLVVMGDRYDMLPAVLAALPLTIPVAHLAGGELTEGVIDDAIRHAVSKLSHLHFPTLPDYARRLMRLGEEPWRITVTGEPGLDVLRTFRFKPREAVLGELGLVPDRPVCVFTLHPETLSPAATATVIAEAVAAAAEGLTGTPAAPAQLVLTYPNADTSADIIIAAIEAFAAGRPGCRVLPHLGRTRYLHLLHHAACMVGNSSSGIVEAASFRLPVVDIGQRQGGRLAPANVLRVPAERSAIAAAWRRALSPDFRAGLTDLINPYGDGHAVPRILERLASATLGPQMLVKHFYDGPVSPNGEVMP